MHPEARYRAALEIIAGIDPERDYGGDADANLRFAMHIAKQALGEDLSRWNPDAFPPWQCPLCDYWNGFLMATCGGKRGCPGKRKDCPTWSSVTSRTGPHGNGCNCNGGAT